MKKNPLWSKFLIAVAIGGLVLAGASRFEIVHASNDVIGVISSDTTWTKADSPYTFTGPVRVNPGVTLTVEPGTTVNLNGYYLQVEGTLHARGNGTDNIHFNGGSDTVPNYAITFASSSRHWNEKATTGFIIENAILSSIYIDNSSPMIRNNSISAFYAIDITAGSPEISNNTINGQIGIHAGTPLIQNNSIIGGINVGWAAPLISNNIIESNDQETGITVTGNASISDNVIYGCQTGISAFYGMSIIEKNLITNNVVGVVVGSESYDYTPGRYGGVAFQAFIRSNSIVNNSIGVNIGYYPPNPQYSTVMNGNITPTIVNNNFQDNANCSIYLGSTLGLNATNNWWGTTDPQSINATIFDNNRDFNLGTVNFIPFLTAPDSEASAITTTPPPTRNHSPSPEPNQASPQVDIQEVVISILVVVVVALSIMMVRMQKRSRTEKKNTG